MRARSLLPLFLLSCAGPRPAASTASEPQCGAPGAGLTAADGASARVEHARRYLAQCGADEIVALTQELVRFPTVSAEQPPTGPAFQAMAARLEGYAREHGLEFRRHGDNDAWEVALPGRDAAPGVAFVMHADVVPPGEAGTGTTGGALPAGWTHAPFDPVLAEGRLYGRGAEDDKGPIAAALVVLRVLAAVGVVPERRLVAVMGTGEEHDWDGMIRYAATATRARFVVSVDANYPVVVAENGFVAWWLSTPDGPVARSLPRDCLHVAELSGGAFLTQVPPEAGALLVPAGTVDGASLLARARAVLSAELAMRPPVGLSLTAEGAGLRLRAQGVSAHSSVADEGQNPLWTLAPAAVRLGLCPGGRADMLQLIARYFAGDHWGEKLGLAYSDPLMGRLLVAATVLKVEQGMVTLGVNMRRPRGRSKADFEAALAAALARLQREISPALHEEPPRYVGEPAVAELEGPLVPTLLAIYRRHTRDDRSSPLSIRGGTYARLFPGAVSFGPALPGRPYRGHVPDEYVELEALRLMGQMLLDAAVELDRRAANQAGATAASR